MCKGGWDTGCVGRVGPIKDSLTYRPGSQGWAPRVLPLSFCLYVIVCVFVCLGMLFSVFCVLGWFFSSDIILLAKMFFVKH